MNSVLNLEVDVNPWISDQESLSSKKMSVTEQEEGGNENCVFAEVHLLVLKVFHNSAIFQECVSL